MGSLDGPDTSMDEAYRIMEENGFDSLDELMEYLLKQDEERYDY